MLARLVKLIENMEENFLRFFPTGKELHIIQNQQINLQIEVLEILKLMILKSIEALRSEIILIDIQNNFIAWITTSTSLFAAIELKPVLAILSAVVLPVVFFSIGKTVDVLLQIYLKDRQKPDR